MFKAFVKWDEYVFDLGEVSNDIQSFDALSVDDKLSEIYKYVDEVNKRGFSKSKKD